MLDDERYPEMFAEAFPDEEDPVNLDSITKALSAFQRSVLSFDSRVDRWQAGDRTALNESEQRGMALFFGAPTPPASRTRSSASIVTVGSCSRSRQTTRARSSTRSSSSTTASTTSTRTEATRPGNEGLFDMTGEVTDKGMFKAPTLRNIALTAPYMHDGSIETLEEVLDHYARGGRLIEEGPNAGDGSLNPNKNAQLNGFVMTEQEKADMIAFLRTRSPTTVC